MIMKDQAVNNFVHGIFSSELLIVFALLGKKVVLFSVG